MNRLAMNPGRLILPIVLMAIAWLAMLGAAFAAPNAFQIPMTVPSGQSSLTAPNPAYTDAIVLLANVSQTQAIPAGSTYVVFSQTTGCDFYAAVGASAAVPVATTTTGGAPQLNPAAWWLYSGPTQITVVSAANCTLTLSFYK